MTLYLTQQWQKRWRDKDPFREVERLSGRIYKEKQGEGRVTFKFQLDGGSYFIKIHRGVGWREIIKNLSQLRLPVLGARQEFLAALKLKELGLETLTPLAYGSRGLNPAKRQSFLITEDLEPALSLATLCRNWVAEPPPFSLKQRLIRKVAAVTRTMHQGGVNHRDFYLCHLLVYPQDLPSQTPDCYVIDLHRAQIRKCVPRRWLVKDLAAIYFSALEIGLTRGDILRFLKIYFAADLRTIFSRRRSLLQEINRRAGRLYAKGMAVKEPPS